jgi:hypothetical protein
MCRLSDDEVFEPPDDGSANYTRVEADRIQLGSYGKYICKKCVLFAFLGSLTDNFLDFAAKFALVGFCFPLLLL